MSKKNNVSINFDKKDFEKNLVKVINKNTDNFAKGMNCPVCNKTVKLKFKNVSRLAQNVRVKSL